MVNKVRTCVFISGNGSNLKSLIKNSKKYTFPIKISLIITNNVNSKGLNIARKHKIPLKHFSYSNKKKFEINALNEIKRRKIKFLCLAGFLKILFSNFIKKFKYKIINIHPSLLPKYKGLNTHKRALINNEKYAGCTVHYVSPDLDAGKIILQKKILIRKNDTETTLQNRVLKLEHKLYSQSIISIFK